jgi:flagella basal body P-ring formation protein FlgA
MRLRALLLLGWTAALAAAQEPVCRAVAGDRIFAKDLAGAIPAFASVPPETPIGTAPLPGSRRTFHFAEIASLARRYTVALPAETEACFEWAMAPLDRAKVLEAMKASLQAPDSVIEIAELATNRVPPGRIEFPRDHLAPPATDQHAPVLWRGDVVYGDNRRFAIWARVDIKVPCNRLIATELLKAGEPIDGSHLRMTASTCFPSSNGNNPTIESVSGMIPIRYVAAGGEVHPELLVAANDVNRGDLIEIEVLSGAARVAFTGQAMSGGRIGDSIAVRNPDSKKIFQARVSGKDKATVQASAPTGDLR